MFLHAFVPANNESIATLCRARPGIASDGLVTCKSRARRVRSGKGRHAGFAVARVSPASAMLSDPFAFAQALAQNTRPFCGRRAVAVPRFAIAA
jgi:hypothetical protein